MTQMTIVTGEDRRRKWPLAERERILAAAFAPGAVVAKVARQFDVASSLIYTWRRQAAGGGHFHCQTYGFFTGHPDRAGE